ncbi:MAG TPA: hypothetical protein VG347_05885 [Verrucomicrobiae bacterium]|nr:hypothetical protein [Verrucomicrobiae bacterium]
MSQPTPEELTDSCLHILRSKFYQGDDKCFYQDRALLLKWVVLYPARLLNKQGVTLHGDQYREIFHKVVIQAAAFVTSKVKFRPAYLRQVIQSHFKIHGEEYYDQAKAVRNLADQALIVLGTLRPPMPDPVQEMAKAADILSVGKPKRTSRKSPVNGQLGLFQ